MNEIIIEKLDLITALLMIILSFSIGSYIFLFFRK